MITLKAPRAGCSFVMQLYGRDTVHVGYGNSRDTVGSVTLNSAKLFGGFIVKVLGSPSDMRLVIDYTGSSREEMIELGLGNCSSRSHGCSFSDNSRGPASELVIPAGTEKLVLRISGGVFDLTAEEPAAASVGTGTFSRPKTGGTGTFTSASTGTSFFDNTYDAGTTRPSVGTGTFTPPKTGGTGAFTPPGKDTSPEPASVSEREELERLRKLVPTLIDPAFSGEYIKTGNRDIDELTKRLNDYRKDAAEKQSKLDELNRMIAVEEERLRDIEKKIRKAEAVKKDLDAGTKEVELNKLLGELGMSESALEMYSGTDTVSSLADEVRDIKNKVSSALRSAVEEKQKNCNDRFNKITAS